jgi:peptidoglycan/LPS O-acetylase OafA/YrhL
VKRETSVYLDLLRFSAAMCVLLVHAHDFQGRAPILWRFVDLASPAVLVFFVLSGYVIAYTTRHAHVRAGDYAVARLARLLSVTVAALALTAVLDTVGRTLDPGLYANDVPPNLPALAMSLVFANEFWDSHFFFGTNTPYWSLGYEVPFYVFFGIAVFTRDRTRILALAAACVVAGPRILALFPLWLLGAGAYFGAKRLTNQLVATGLLLASVVGMVVFVGPAGGLQELSGLVDTYNPRQIAFSYVLCMLFALHIAAFSAVAEHVPLLGRARRPVQWLAGATFSLYLFHKPIIVLLCALHVLPRDPAVSGALLVGITFAACLALAELTERKRLAWRAALNAVVRRILPTASVATDA